MHLEEVMKRLVGNPVHVYSLVNRLASKHAPCCLELVIRRVADPDPDPGQLLLNSPSYHDLV